MAILDVPAFKPVLTPEVALGIIQKELKKRGWPKFDVSSIKLVYTPYYTFSFDVLAEGAPAPSAKAALNANTGELNDLIPFLLERPLERVRESEPKAEVETTNISAPEVKEAAGVKVAASVGVKREVVMISAVAKLYSPAYRVWVNVGDDTYKIEIDAAVGAPKGFEAIPTREKGWGEVTEETVTKMKSPAGWFELFGAMVKSIPEILSGKGKGPVAGIVGSPQGKIALLVILVLVLMYFAFLVPKLSITCAASPDFPKVVKSTMWLNGTCTFNNPGNRDEVATLAVFALEDGKETGFRSLLSVAVKANSEVVKNVALSWNNTLTKDFATYTMGFRKV